MNDIDIDSVLKAIGEFGTYQKRIYVALFIPILFIGASNLAYVFIAAKPQYRCVVPHCDSVQNPANYNAPFLPFTIPRNKDGSYNSCQRFVFLNDTLDDRRLSSQQSNNSVQNSILSSYSKDNDSENKQCIASEFSKITVEDCPEGHVFDNSVYQTTIITEFNLTCSEGWKAQASQSIYFGGMLAGAFMWGIFSDWAGRRPTILLTLVLMVLSGVATALLPNFAAFNISRFLNAMTSTGVFQTIFVLGLEVVGPQYRVPCAMVGQIVFALGELALGVAGLFIRRWRMLQLVISVPLTAGILYYFVVPESPRWLQSQGRTTEALVVLQSIASANKSRIPTRLLPKSTVTAREKTSVSNDSSTRVNGTGQEVSETEQEVFEIEQEVFETEREGEKVEDSPAVTNKSTTSRHNHAEPACILPVEDDSVSFSNTQLIGSNEDIQQSKTSLLEIVQTPLLGLRLFSFIVIWIVTTLVYYGLSLNSAALDGGATSSDAPYISFILASLVEVPGYLLAMLLQQCWGRRPALVLSLLVAGLACIGAGLLHDYPSMYALVASLVGKFGITSAFGAIYLHTAEVFPTGARNAVLGLCSTLARLGGMLAPFSDNLGSVYPPLPLLVFGGLSVVASFCSLVQPETRGTTLPDTIDEAMHLGRRSALQALADEERRSLLQQQDEDEYTAEE